MLAQDNNNKNESTSLIHLQGVYSYFCNCISFFAQMVNNGRKGELHKLDSLYVFQSACKKTSNTFIVYSVNRKLHKSLDLLLLRPK